MLHTSLLDSILRFIFPDRCCICRSIGDLLCTRCQSSFHQYPQLQEEAPPALDHMAIALVFYGSIRQVIHHFKYRSAKRLAVPLATLLANKLMQTPNHYDAIVAVPLHEHRLQQRGYNQALLLAEALAPHLHIKVQAGLVRTRATSQQARLNLRERAENMQGAFMWQAVSVPQRVLLIDDVLTTGATMNACAEALRQAGASYVGAAAIARSLPGYVPDRYNAPIP